MRPLSIIAALLGLAVMAGAATATATPVRVQVLSNRSDLISGGDALVAVRTQSARRARITRLKLNGKRIAKRSIHWHGKRGTGLVTGLRVGRNLILAHAGKNKTRTTIVDHPSGGPIFSGPQVKPWVCRNPAATDAQCDQPPTFEYQYMSSVTHSLQPYDPSSPPPDVATTTTDKGRTVPFIIRIETGYLDRDQYQYAVLYDPSKPWHPWKPQRQWNHKLLITHGASCGIDHRPGRRPASPATPSGFPGRRRWDRRARRRRSASASRSCPPRSTTRGTTATSRRRPNRS